MMTQSGLKAKIVAASALVFLFGSGVVVGLAWDQTADANTPEEIRSGERTAREDRTRRPMIVDRVGLSVAQKTTVDSLYFFYGRRESVSSALSGVSLLPGERPVLGRDHVRRRLSGLGDTLAPFQRHTRLVPLR